MILKLDQFTIPVIRFNGESRAIREDGNVLEHCEHLNDKGTHCTMNYCVENLPMIQINGCYQCINDIDLVNCRSHVSNANKYCYGIKNQLILKPLGYFNSPIRRDFYDLDFPNVIH